MANRTRTPTRDIAIYSGDTLGNILSVYVLGEKKYTNILIFGVCDEAKNMQSKTHCREHSACERVECLWPPLGRGHIAFTLCDICGKWSFCLVSSYIAMQFRMSSNSSYICCFTNPYMILFEILTIFQDFSDKI